MPKVKKAAAATTTEYTPTAKINLRERIDAIQYKQPTAKSVVASKKGSKLTGPRVSQMPSLMSLKDTLGKQFSKK